VSDANDELIELAAACTHDPLRWARIAFDWGMGELHDSEGPRQWQADVMTDIKAHLSNADTRFMPMMISVASGHGIGKSAGIGMLINWAMSTC